ncbi:MAG: glycine--tRNA ligase subunit beta, partial [Acidithiobacillus ferrooxidans]
EIPADAHGQCLAIADKLDTLCGFFAIGKVPTGDRDPFALRRAALGVLRIVLDAGVPLNLDEAVTRTLAAYGGAFARNRTEIRSAILDFFQDRMRVYFREEGFRADQIAAVLSRQPHEPLDARQRLEALVLFQAEHAAADALAALIKRINNLLRKEVISGDRPIDPQYFMDPVENTLWDYWRALEQPLHAQLAERRYAAALGLLAGLRPAVDQFFDGVMVLAEDPVLRQNRLALLARLQEAFLRIADFSQLQGA